MLYYGIGISAKATAGQAAEIFPHYVELIGAAVLVVLLAFAIWKNYIGGSSCSTC
jgi:hypothetical protein